MRVVIGVLAIQGSFREHISSLKRIDGVDAIEVRTKEDIAKVQGLIIPGKSTIITSFPII
jgi:5'-phosphate synthase pdxT subunit